jgi:hypothetical protein
MRHNGKDRASLREVMRSWKTPAYRSGPESAELSPRIPPSRPVHLPESRYHKPQFEKLFKVHRCGNHRVFLSSGVSILNSTTLALPWLLGKPFARLTAKASQTGRSFDEEINHPS